MKTMWLIWDADVVESIQVPSLTQSEFAPAVSCAAPQIPIVPTNPDWKVMARLTVSVVPEPLAEEVDPSMLHWLFCNVPGLPGVNGPSHPVAVSFINAS